MATPSQQTNQILDLLERIAGDPTSWSELESSLAARIVGQEQSREEFESRAQQRGPDFLQKAESRLAPVRAGFKNYADCLQRIQAEVKDRRLDLLQKLRLELQEATQQLFLTLDAYAAFYFSWGETQSPLVTMIRQAAESYSRSALQSTQAQRILQDMNQHLGASPRPSKESSRKEGQS